MNITQLIEKKKYGNELSDDEIYWIINAYTEGKIENYHMAAFAMAVYFMGMSDRETTALTFAMADSGDKIDLSAFGKLSGDKHSTGGVGDKTSLIVAPIVATLGGKIAKMSGRGLGHTGGTVDKLESISGYKTNLTNSEFIDCATKTGIALTGATANLAPADKKLYALRDVTATVDSIPLITSSVMSKKIAAGAKNIVIDVKCGSGAFMTDLKSAESLAEKIVAIGKLCDRNIAAIITDMDTPLGHAVGNAIEVQEAIQVLQGNGAADLTTVSLKLASELLTLIHGEGDWESKARNSLLDGSAYKTFQSWITTQGGDLNNIAPISQFSYEVRSDTSGYISHMNTKDIGEAAMLLGAGRSSIDDKIDMGAGIIIKKKTGEYIEKDEVIAIFYAESTDLFDKASSLYKASIAVADKKPISIPLIYKIIN